MNEMFLKNKQFEKFDEIYIYGIFFLLFLFIFVYAHCYCNLSMFQEYFGDNKSVSANSSAVCKTQCDIAGVNCQAYSYNTSTSKCVLYSNDVTNNNTNVAQLNSTATTSFLNTNPSPPVGLGRDYAS